jgi:hypothetical protein
VQRLTEDQRARIEKLATEEGTTCEGCGRAGLRCGEEARRTQDHGLIVYLWCANEVRPLSLPGCCRTLERGTSTTEVPSCSAEGVRRRSHRCPEGRDLGLSSRAPATEGEQALDVLA